MKTFQEVKFHENKILMNKIKIKVLHSLTKLK